MGSEPPEVFENFMVTLNPTYDIKKKFTVRSKLTLRVFLVGYSVAMVTY